MISLLGFFLDKMSDSKLCFYFFIQHQSACAVIGFVFYIFVFPQRVPGTKNDQEVSKRKCEENVECHHVPFKEKTSLWFYTMCVEFDCTALCWSVDTVQPTHSYFGTVVLCRLHFSEMLVRMR